MKIMKKLLVLLMVCLALTACAAAEPDIPQNPEIPEPNLVSVPMDIPEMDPPKTEPTYDLYISDQPVPTVSDGEVTDWIPAFIINNTGEDAEVLLIPHLEKLDKNGE